MSTGEPPAVLDGARVVRYAVIDPTIEPTGRTVHRFGGRVLGPASGLAICRYDRDEGYDLFSCDESWTVFADTYHDSLAGAMDQAEFEYRGVSEAWRSVG